MIVIRANPVSMVWSLPVEYLPPTPHLDLITLNKSNASIGLCRMIL